MTEEELRDLAGRLVVRRKADGRGVYDEQAKAELVAECGRPGRSISRLARECGVNANQLARWLREDRQRRVQGVILGRPAELPGPFMPVAIEAGPSQPAAASAPSMSLQARLPNGVAIDVHDCALAQMSALLEALGSLPCSA